VIYVDDFNWEDSNEFQIKLYNELIIYELHIGTFYKKEGQNLGDFASAIEKLDYISELGINTVEVTPIAEFPGDFSWGYNPSYPFAVESVYGGPNGFKNFVKEAHKRNIAVILDVVYNHFGPTDMDLWQFDGWSENEKGGIYFYNDWKAVTPWGETRPDYGREEVRQYIYDNAMMWLNEFKCDGLRMDMIPYMRNVNADGNSDNDIPEAKSLLQWINKDIQENFPGKLILAEDLHTLDEITAKVKDNGFGYGSQWCAAFVHPVRAILTNSNDADRDLFGLEMAMNKKYNNDAFERIVYTESHDEVANGQARIAEEIAESDVNNYFSKKRSQLAAALIFTAPGIPMIFQGQEMLEDGFFEDTDPIDWKNINKHSKFIAFFKELIALRSNFYGNTKGLQSQNIQTIHLDNQNKIYAFHRFDVGGVKDSVVTVINFSNQEFPNYQIEFPFAANWELLINSDSEYYMTDNKNRDVNFELQGQKALMHVVEYGILMFAITT
jgi:1,4-alpha-glucan branching enzyme